MSTIADLRAEIKRLTKERNAANRDAIGARAEYLDACAAQDEMEKENKRLRAVLVQHAVQHCEVCGVYERPFSHMHGRGIGGIQPEDIGIDSQGRTVHASCANKPKKPKPRACVASPGTLPK